jgi:hypothetical protein
MRGIPAALLPGAKDWEQDDAPRAGRLRVLLRSNPTAWFGGIGLPQPDLPAKPSAAVEIGSGPRC